MSDGRSSAETEHHNKFEPMWQNPMIGDVTPETKVFRIFPVFRLEEVFQDKRITLVRPAKWGDPCENQLYNIKLVDKVTGAPVSVESLRSCLYGQSWTLTEESDALWRIYSEDKRGVRVATTAGKLLQAFLDGCGSNEQLKPLKCFFGKVAYHTEEEYLKQFESPVDCLAKILDGTGRNPADSLLLKREAFSHENEARLIYQETDSSVDHGPVWSFPVDPTDLFDEICFDPRLPEECFEVLKNSFISKYHFPGRILKSDLYRLPLPETCVI